MRWSSVILALLTIQLVNCDPLTKQENEQRLASCGKSVQSKVYMGREAKQTEAPWSVFFLIGDPDPKKGSITCTGTIVTSRHILIATHCFAELEAGKWKILGGNSENSNCQNDDYVITDESFLKRITIQSNGKQIARAPEKVTLVNACLQRSADKTKNFPKSNPQHYIDDFAIIDLYEELIFSNTVQPVCVADDPSTKPVGTKLDYFGFGLNPPTDLEINPPPDNSGVLRHESIQVLGNVMEDYYFLARDKAGNNVACVGDSGGGAIGEINGKKTIVGVLSQTNCQHERDGAKFLEQYALVGYYHDKICKWTGICKTFGDYEKHHDKDYVRKDKPIRPTEDPVVIHNMGPPPGDQSGGKPDGSNGKHITPTEESQVGIDNVENAQGAQGDPNGSPRNFLHMILFSMFFFVIIQ